MDNNQKLKIITEIQNEIWNDKNLSIVDERFMSQSIVESPVKFGTGNELLKMIIDSWHFAFPQLVYKQDSVEYNRMSNIVILNWSCKGRHINVFQNIAPMGNYLEYQGKTVYHLKDDKITQYYANVDMQKIYSQLNKDALYENSKVSVLQQTIFNIQEIFESRLTKQQIYVLALISTNLSVKQISQIMEIGVETVNTHKKNAFSHLKMKNTKEFSDFLWHSNYLDLFQNVASKIRFQKRASIYER